MQQAKLFEVSGPVAGVDEAGRGPLAGPVVAAAVILDSARPIAGLADSKKLTAARREELAVEIRRRALAYSVARADASEVDELNVLSATMLAMRRAIIRLHVQPRYVKVDGNRLPNLQFGHRTLAGEAVVRGDSQVAAISAASILAKTARDAIMIELDRIYPRYGFARHKGYCTQVHRKQLRRHGPCREHRRSFAPVRAAV